MFQLTALVQTGREKAIKNDTLLKRSHNKQRKQVNFTQVQQNSSEVSDKTSQVSEISPILESYEQ